MRRIALVVIVLVSACSRRAAPPAPGEGGRVPPKSVPPSDVEAVRAQLSKMVAADQNARRNRFPLADVDRANTATMKTIVAKYVWPTIPVFGRGADRDAWLLVQHADHDRAFQKEVLAILARLKDTGETAPSNHAYLYDRVAVGEAMGPDGREPAPDAQWSRRQRYGTQGGCVGDRWEPFPVEDPARLDELRKSVGLGPLAEYQRVFKCR